MEDDITMDDTSEPNRLYPVKRRPLSREKMRKIVDPDYLKGDPTAPRPILPQDYQFPFFKGYEGEGGEVTEDIENDTTVDLPVQPQETPVTPTNTTPTLDPKRKRMRDRRRRLRRMRANRWVENNCRLS